MHLYSDTASNKPVNNYDVELVAPPSDLVDNYCKGHGASSGEYPYTHVWQPASLASIDVAQYQRANRMIPTELTTSAAAMSGARRHCCRDHVYESPTFDENGIDRPGALVFPPYYYHSSAAMARQSRPSEGSESRPTATQLPLSVMTTADEHCYQHQQQQQHQPAGQASASDDNTSVSVGGHETVTMRPAAAGACERYQACRTARYEPVICRTSSSDPDVTLRPRTENHYT